MSTNTHKARLKIGLNIPEANTIPKLKATLNYLIFYGHNVPKMQHGYTAMMV